MNTGSQIQNYVHILITDKPSNRNQLRDLTMGLCQSIKKKENVKIESGKIHIKKEEKGFKIEVKPIVSNYFKWCFI